MNEQHDSRTASQGIPASAPAKTKTPAPKRRRTVIEEDPFETNEENNVSTDDSNKDGADGTSSNEEERSDSEDGLGGDNVEAILTAEVSKRPHKSFIAERTCDWIAT